MTETKTCSQCGKQMIRCTAGVVETSYPPRVGLIWWCGCGAREDAGWKREPSDHEVAMAAWERVNAPPSPRFCVTVFMGDVEHKYATLRLQLMVPVATARYLANPCQCEGCQNWSAELNSYGGIKDDT